MEQEDDFLDCVGNKMSSVLSFLVFILALETVF